MLVNAFNDAKNTVVGYIQTIIDWINRIPGVNINTNTGGNGGGHRASGGPVIAGQSYNVAEFSRPEVFTPNKSGRIDPKEEQAYAQPFDMYLLGRIVALELAKVTN
jgi:SLT domain-containing protein